jgi:Fibronectin type III domain
MSEDTAIPPGRPTAQIPVPAPPRRKRRWWVLALTGVAVFCLAFGLIVWSPWNQPPAAPAAVVATSPTATTVAVSWSASNGGATPDHYLVLRDGTQVGSVPASRTSFTDNGLAPGSTHHYTVIAAAGGQRSGVSVKAAVTTITPSPLGLGVTKSTWTTVTVHWSPSPLGPAADLYEIYDGASVVGTVPGTVDSYTATSLTPGASYHYRVMARWGNFASAPSAALTASTLEPPLSGFAPVHLDTVSTPGAGASLSVGERWTDTWQFTPDCAATGCTLRLDAGFSAPGFANKPFTLTLNSSGGDYTGSTKAQISYCGSAKSTNTVTLRIAPTGAVADGAWNAWSGTMQVSSPYVTVGDEFCAAQSWSFTMTGTDG